MKPRGFAALPPEQRQEIGRKGGESAQEQGTAYKLTPEKARVAGRKGGLALSRDRAHMAEIGRKGGLAAGRRRARLLRQLAGQPTRETEPTPGPSPPAPAASLDLARIAADLWSAHVHAARAIELFVTHAAVDVTRRRRGS